MPDIVGATDASDVDAILDAISGSPEIGAGMKRAAAAAKGRIAAKDLPVGFAGLTVLSLATTLSGTTTAPLNVAMRVDRVVIGQAACVALSRLTQMQIGSINLLVGSAPIPCEVFRYDAVATSIKAAVTATPSVPPSFSFTNATAGTVVYEGCIMGPVTREGT